MSWVNWWQLAVGAWYAKREYVDGKRYSQRRIQRRQFRIIRKAVHRSLFRGRSWFRF